MKVNLKKMWPAAAASLVFFTSLANAATGSATDNRQQGASRTNGNMKPEITPPARPVVKDGVDLFVSGDFLWWKAEQDNLQYVATVNAGAPVCDTTTSYYLQSYKLRNHAPQYKYDPGFRVGIGYNMPYDGWDLFVNWTRFYTSASDKRCACPVEAISSASPCDFNACNTCCPTNPCGGCNQCCFPALAVGTSTSACCPSSPCGDCNQCCSSSSSSSCCFTQCCPSEPCGNCNQCCSSLSCNDCCLPCCPCCEVCYEGCCPTALVPSLSPLDSNFSFGPDMAKAKWRLHFNTLDGEIGREFFLSKHLTMRPFFGIRGAWINQKLKTQYHYDVTAVDPGFFGFTSSEIHRGEVNTCTTFKNNFTGVGPRIGFNTLWMIGSGFGFYANAAISLLWGEFDVKANTNMAFCAALDSVEFPLDLDTGSTELSMTTVINDCARLKFKDEFHSTKAATDLALGIQWQGSFADDRVGLMIQIGYDNHIFFNQNQIIAVHEALYGDPVQPLIAAGASSTAINTLSKIGNPVTGVLVNKLETPTRRAGDLALQGLTVSARLDF
jgi:Legionella pneumophila major outer membrane protein precursor